MNAGTLIILALNILQAVLEQSQKENVSAEIVAGVEKAIENLMRVRGSDVTLAQLESLRVKQLF